MTTDNCRKHTSRNPLQRWLIERFHNTLLSELDALHPGSVLDAGCGEGFTLARIRSRNPSMTLEGIELQEGAIELGKKLHPDLVIRNGSIYSLPYPDNSFDVVLCLEVLEHLEEPERALAELKRVAKRYCILSVPHEPFFMVANFLRGKNLSRFGNDPEHINHWTARGAQMLAERFFKVRGMRIPFPWTIVIGEKA